MPAPLLVPALLGGLATVMGSLVGRVLIALSIGFVTFSGVSILIDNIKTGIIVNMQSMGADTVQLLGYLWVDKALTMIFSAWVAALALKMAGGTSIKKMMVK